MNKEKKGREVSCVIAVVCLLELDFGPFKFRFDKEEAGCGSGTKGERTVYDTRSSRDGMPQTQTDSDVTVQYYKTTQLGMEGRLGRGPMAMEIAIGHWPPKTLGVLILLAPAAALLTFV